MTRKLFFLIAIVCFPALCSGDERFLQYDDVMSKLKEIETRVYKERCVAFVTIAAGVAYICSGMTWNTKEVVTNNASNVVSEGLLKKTIARCKWLLCTSDGWKGIARYMFNCAGIVGWNFISQELIKKFWHPYTLHWYVCACVPYKKTLSSMKHSIQQLHIMQATEIQKKIHKDSLSVACSKLNHHAACLCAYMLYKSKELLCEQSVQLAQKMSVYLFNYHNDMMTSFLEQIDSQEPDYERLYKDCEAYEKEMAYFCEQFSCIEGETDMERCIV